MSYQEKLNRKEWQDKSHRIKTRDNLKCQAFNCITPISILQVHHLDYINNTEPWNYPDDMLITLCSECHLKENNRYNLEANLFTALKFSRFLSCDILAMTTLLHSDLRFATSLFKVIRKYQNG